MRRVKSNLTFVGLLTAKTIKNGGFSADHAANSKDASSQRLGEVGLPYFRRRGPWWIFEDYKNCKSCHSMHMTTSCFNHQAFTQTATYRLQTSGSLAEQVGLLIGKILTSATMTWDDDRQAKGYLCLQGILWLTLEIRRRMLQYGPTSKHSQL